MKKNVRTPKNSLDKEKVTNHDTMTHINHVRRFINEFVKDLLDRSEKHDKSKMEEPELPIFMEFTPKLGTVEYNSNEYKKFLKDMKPALDHHYANNSHHPEHFKNGIDDMDLIDLLEMVADWQASIVRSKNGDINASLKINKDRFKISDQLENVLRNTFSKIGK